MENLVFVEEPRHPNTVLEGLNRLRLDNELCDVVLCCGGQEFPCHRVVLASFSSYFQAMFTTGMLESRQDRVDLHGVEPHIIELLLTYAYTSKMSIPKAHLQDLVAAAHMLYIKAVQEVCCRYMDRHINKNNCLGIHSFAEALSFETLEQHSLDYIIKHFRDVYQQEEFPSLSLDKVTRILSNEDLNVPKEEMVFEAAMLWLNKCPTRRQHFQKVLELIHLPLISPSYLHDVIEALDVVKESQCCQRIISEAKAKDQHLLPYCKTVHPRRTTEVIVMVEGRSDYELICNVECFNPLTKECKMLLSSPWKSLASLPISVRRHGLAVLGTTLYLAGGELPNSYSSELWRYDPSNDDSWMKMTPMNRERCDFGLVMLDGYLWAVGGHDDPRCIVERYDPNTNTWQLMESVDNDTPGPSNSCVVALDGLIYYIDAIAEEQTDGSPDKDMVYKYNPKTSVWTELAPMQVARSALAACALNGKIYAIGGDHSSVTTNAVECYDPRTNQWTMRAPMRTPRRDPGVAVMAGKIYVLGGLDGRGRDLCTIERYCDQTDTWESVGKGIPDGRSCFSCVSLWLSKDVYNVPTYVRPDQFSTFGI